MNNEAVNYSEAENGEGTEYLTDVGWTLLEMYLSTCPTAATRQWDAKLESHYRFTMCVLPDAIMPKLLRRIAAKTKWLPSSMELLEIASDLMLGEMPTQAESMTRLIEGLEWYKSKRGFPRLEGQTMSWLDLVYKSFRDGDKSRGVLGNSVIEAIVEGMGGMDLCLTRTYEANVALFLKMYPEQATREHQRRLTRVSTGEVTGTYLAARQAERLAAQGNNKALSGQAVLTAGNAEMEHYGKH